MSGNRIAVMNVIVIMTIASVSSPPASMWSPSFAQRFRFPMFVPSLSGYLIVFFYENGAPKRAFAAPMSVNVARVTNVTTEGWMASNE